MQIPAPGPDCRFHPGYMSLTTILSDSVLFTLLTAPLSLSTSKQSSKNTPLSLKDD